MSQNLSPRELAASWFHRLWTEYDGSAIPELMAPDARAELEGGLVTHGPEGFAEFYNAIRGTFPDIKVNVLEIIGEGDRAYVRWEANGTHTGGAMGIAPTNAPHAFRGITWMKVENGQIVEGGDSWNQSELLAKMASAAVA